MSDCKDDCYCETRSIDDNLTNGDAVAIGKRHSEYPRTRVVRIVLEEVGCMEMQSFDWLKSGVCTGFAPSGDP